MPIRKDRDGLYRRKDSPRWWASYTDASGRRTRRSTGTADRNEAEALLAKWRLESHREAKWGEQPSRTFDELMLRYLRGPGARKRSKERDHFSARHLFPVFSGRELHTLTASDVRGYIDSRLAAGVEPGTVNREIGLLSSALNYARRDLDWDIPNPATGRRLREPEGRLRYLSRDEAFALIQAAADNKRAPYLAPLIRLALHTGCRRGELLSLRWPSVDLGRGLIMLDGNATKSGRRRSVPLNAEARAALAELSGLPSDVRDRRSRLSVPVIATKKGKPVLSVKRSFASACKAAGIADFTFHDLRHTCAAWLVSAGVPLPEVRDLLGHSTIRMTERYAHLAPENVRAAVAKIEGVSSRSGHVGLAVVGKEAT